MLNLVKNECFVEKLKVSKPMFDVGIVKEGLTVEEEPTGSSLIMIVVFVFFQINSSLKERSQIWRGLFIYAK